MAKPLELKNAEEAGNMIDKRGPIIEIKARLWQFVGRSPMTLGVFLPEVKVGAAVMLPEFQD